MEKVKLSHQKQQIVKELLGTKTKGWVRRREIYIDDDTGEQIARFTQYYRDTHPIDFPTHPGEFALKLHERDHFAPLAKVYFNFRNLPEELVLDLAQALAELKFSTKPDCVTGIPDGAVPFARKYSELTNIPYEDFLIKEEAHGKRSIVTYQTPLTSPTTPKKLLLIEDVITEGTSCREAIRPSEYLGYEVVGIAGIVDREEGGVQRLIKSRYEALTVFQLTPMMQECLGWRRIDQKKFDEIMNYK